MLVLFIIFEFAGICTGKDEYKASKKDEEGLFDTMGSLFQGLHTDLDGFFLVFLHIFHWTDLLGAAVWYQLEFSL